VTNVNQALPPPLANLMDELAADHRGMVALFTGLAREADDNYDALELLQEMGRIAERPGSTHARLVAIAETLLS
jgi:hypothetical protein